MTVRPAQVPLRADEYGVIRVGDSQVLLDVVIREFKQGQTPQAIAESYPTVELADIYGVIAYYLHNQTEVDEYLQVRKEEAEKLRQEIEAKQSPALRAKLLAWKTRREQEHASS